MIILLAFFKIGTVFFFTKCNTDIGLGAFFLKKDATYTSTFYSFDTFSTLSNKDSAKDVFYEFHNIANTYLFRVNSERLEKGVKYVQSCRHFSVFILNFEQVNVYWDTTIS